MRRAPCGQAERAEGGTSGTLVAEEILGALQRETVKEALVKCVLAPRRPPHYLPQDSSIDLAEGPSVSGGKPKSALAPIRRPPYSNFARMCKVAAKAPFSLTPGAARSLFGQDQKENGGRICQPSPWLFPRPMGQHLNEPIMTRDGDEVAAPIVRRNELVSQRPYRGISSMVNASMMSPSLMSLNFSTVRPHS